MIDSIDGFTGEFIKDKAIRNVLVLFTSKKFDIKNDLVVIQILDKNYSKTINFKNKKEKFKLLINEDFINLPRKKHRHTYQVEIFLDKLDYEFKELNSEELFLDINLSFWIFKNYKKRKKELKLLKDTTIDNLIEPWTDGEFGDFEKDIDYEYASIFISENDYEFGRSNSLQDYMFNEHIIDQTEPHKSKDSSIPEEPTLDEIEKLETELYEDYFENEKEFNNFEIETFYENLLRKYSLNYIYELKHFYFVGLGFLLANVDNEFSISEKDLIEKFLLEELDLKTSRKIIRDVESRFNKNNLTMSSLIDEVRDSLYSYDKNNLIQKLYALISVDGKATSEELLFLDKICESLNIDFEFVKDVKTQELLNVDIEKVEGIYAMLEVDFSAPIDNQVEQAEDQLYLWNSRLNTLTDPKKRTNAQLLIDQYSEFLNMLKTSENSKKIDLNTINFPLPVEHSDSKINQMRKKYPRHYARWSMLEEETLKKLYEEGYSISKIAKLLQRVEDAIEMRLEKLQLI